MDKGVTVKDIEQNLRDGAIVGIDGFSTWITGFPTEEHQDHYETMTMIWRNRNTSLNTIPAGAGFNITPETIVAQHMTRFGVAKMSYEGDWIREDFTNSKYHRLIRLKAFAIFLNNLVNEKNTLFGDRPHIINHYDIQFKHEQAREIEFEQFDFKICKPEINSFVDSLSNEIWPLLRLFYITRGAYSINIRFDPELDKQEFGDVLSGDFTANIKFDIDDSGKWVAKFDYSLKQRDNAWKYFDMGSANSVGAERAKKLSGINDSTVTFDEMYQSAMKKFPQLDFSFEYSYNGEGQW